MGFQDSISDILSEELIVALRNASGATCGLVDPDDHSRLPRLITESVELLSSDLKLLTKLLLDVESWYFARKRCLPKRTAIVTIKSGAGDSRLHIGMNCADWLLVGCGHRAGGFFDPVRNEVRNVLQRAFPDIASPHGRSMWKQGAIHELKLKSRGDAG